MTEQLHFHFSLSCIGEGNGNPLQCSCLENPRDGEPSGLPSMGSHRVRHDWSDLAAAAFLQAFQMALVVTPANVGEIRDSGSIPGWERSSREGMSEYPLQYSCLENPLDRGAWWTIVYGIAKSRTRLSNEHITSHHSCLTCNYMICKVFYHFVPIYMTSFIFH